MREPGLDVKSQNGYVSAIDYQPYKQMANGSVSSPVLLDHEVANQRPGDFLATVLLPAYNEETALPTVLEDLHQCLDGSYEIIVIDDGSQDRTAELALQSGCTLVRHLANQGKGAAVRTGLAYAQGTYIVIMDADATYPACPIPQIVELLQTYGLVRCCRQETKQSMPGINQVGNKLFDFFINRIAGVEGEDQLSGLYGIRRSDLLRMELESQKFDLEAEINMKSHLFGLSAYVLPVEYLPRLGQKKLKPFQDGWRILQRILLMILVTNPKVVFIIPGLVVMISSILGAVVLNETNIITPYFGLSIHSFILAQIGTLAGFQIMMFGVAASLYAVDVGKPIQPWLVAISSPQVRLSAAAAGAFFAIYGFIQIVALVFAWLNAGAGDFLETRELVLAAVTLVGGLQVLSAALYISIFASRINAKARLKKNGSQLNSHRT